MYVPWNAHHPKDIRGGQQLVTDIEKNGQISIKKSEKRIIILDFEGALELARNLVAAAQNVDPQNVSIITDK